MKNNLSYLLTPEKIAILGASDDKLKAGGRAIGYMLTHGYKGEIYPINPNRKMIQGLTAYPNLESLPCCPDVVIISLAAKEVEQALESCISLGVKVVVIYSSGFAELGDAGKNLQNKLFQRAKEHGVRLLGPNTQGYANFSNYAILSFSTMIQEEAPQDGTVAIISQSGAGAAILYGGVRRVGLGVRYMFATGNEVDVHVSELLMEVLQDDAIRVVILYMESIKDPNQFKKVMLLAHQRNVPVLLIKAGRTESGKLTVSSHTGALAGEEKVTSCFLERCGVIRVDDFTDAIKNVVVFEKFHKVQGNNVVTISNSGATCVLAADAAEYNQLCLHQFSHSEQKGLRSILPDYVNARNPIDMTTALLGQPQIYGEVLRQLSILKSVDAIHVGFPIGGEGYDFHYFAKQTAEFMQISGLPVVVSVNQQWVAEIFRQQEVPVFYSEKDAMTALSLLYGYSKHRYEALSSNEFFLTPVVKFPRSLQESPFSEVSSLRLLDREGFPIASFRECKSLEDVRNFNYLPQQKYVAKIITSKITHKSDYGLVRLNIETAQQAEQAFNDFISIMSKLDKEHEGMLLAEQQKGDFEFVMGAHIDSELGAVVMIGVGGILVEAINDVQFLLMPFTVQDALKAIYKLKIFPALMAVRGLESVDIEQLALLLVQFGEWFIGQQGRILSVDVNPLIVRRGNKSPIIVDAVVIENKG